MISLNYAEFLIHAPYRGQAKIAWDFAKHYSRHQKTGAIKATSQNGILFFANPLAYSIVILFKAVILIRLPGSGIGELFDGPAFIATQAAIFAEEPAACRTVSLQLPVKPVNGHLGPVTAVRRRKSAAMPYGQPAEEDRHMRDTLNIIAGVGMSDIGRPSGKVCNRAM